MDKLLQLKAILSFILLPIFFQISTCQQNWALLVAGSMGYVNYRHQADVSHAYHVLRNHGFSKENIIVMMYDDIAYSYSNPYPGQIINHPDGPNVYKGVTIDYSQDEVRPDVFLSVLSGDAKSVKDLVGKRGRVVKSGPDDRIFLNFVDHGGPGILAFPKEILHAKELHKILKKMHRRKQYKEMLLYIEACHAGSMFDGILENDINVFVTTAANPDESSFACYFDDKRNTYLGDLYSVNWMEDSDQENLNIETLTKQYRLVKKETNMSHVMEYGDLSISTLAVADFQGNETDNSLYFLPSRTRHPASDAVPSEDVPVEILKRKISKSFGDELAHLKFELLQLQKKIDDTEKYFTKIAELASNKEDYESIINGRLNLRNHDCYQTSIKLIRQTCPGLDLVQNHHAMKKLKVLANLCSSEVDQGRISKAIDQASSESYIC